MPDGTCFGLRDEVSGYKLFKEQIEVMQDEQVKVLSDRVAGLDVELMGMALLLDEGFYPRFLTAIAGQRWIISRGFSWRHLRDQYITAFLKILTMSEPAGLNLSPPMFDVRNTVGKRNEQISKNLNRPVCDAALREYCDKHYHQLLPIIAKKVYQEKVQQEKLKARINFEGCSGRNSKIQEVSQHSESRTPNVRGEQKKGRRSGRSRSMFENPERTSVFSRIRHDRPESPRHRLVGRTESVPRKHHHERIHRKQKCTPKVKIAEGDTKSQDRKSKSQALKDNLSQPWVCEESDPFTPHAKVEHWAMPTWCHMFNFTLTGFASMHAGTRSMVAKAIQTGYYWPTMHTDARKMIWECLDCQAHRTMIRSSNEDTPFSLTYRTKAVIPAEIGRPTLRTMEIHMAQNNEALGINLDLLEERMEQATIREARSKTKMEKYYNSKIRNSSFKPGDLVYRNNHASHAKDSGKLSPKWGGPYEVTEALGKRSYMLKDRNGKLLPRTWNVRILKKCYWPEM
nr:reverse transcriptase domain-containing protein [Tanacetum cinerariifolium]